VKPSSTQFSTCDRFLGTLWHNSSEIDSPCKRLSNGILSIIDPLKTEFAFRNDLPTIGLHSMEDFMDSEPFSVSKDPRETSIVFSSTNNDVVELSETSNLMNTNDFFSEEIGLVPELLTKEPTSPEKINHENRSPMDDIKFTQYRQVQKGSSHFLSIVDQFTESNSKLISNDSSSNDRVKEPLCEYEETMLDKLTPGWHDFQFNTTMPISN